MNKNFFNELKRLGTLKDFSNGLLDVQKKSLKGYCGFDLTAESLQIGNLATIVLLKRFQNFGYKAIALLGGATSLIGDPSFKKEERILVDKEEILFRKEKISSQLKKLLNNDCEQVQILDNSEWFSKINLIDFLRDTGKFFTVNYLQAKDSVKERMLSGISYSEFSYQLFQAYDFCYLYENYGVNLQMGGADQWGNITSGIELGRKKMGVGLHGLTIPLVTKSDGSKFGKSESGKGLWLDKKMTSPYEFYQFWINSSDEEAGRYLRVFTLKNLEEIYEIERKHFSNPENRILQKSLAEDVTTLVHSKEEMEKSRKSSEILFSKEGDLREIDNDYFEEIFYNFPTIKIDKSVLGENLKKVLVDYCQGEIFSSRGDFDRVLRDGGIYINKKKIVDYDDIHLDKILIHNKYLVVQRGKKNYFLIKVQ